MQAHKEYLAYTKAIGAIVKDKGFYCWGASAVLPTLLDQMGIDQTNLEGIIDSDPEKQGRECCGMMVYAPEMAKGAKIIVTAPDNFFTIYMDARAHGAKFIASAVPLLLGEV